MSLIFYSEHLFWLKSKSKLKKGMMSSFKYSEKEELYLKYINQHRNRWKNVVTDPNDNVKVTIKYLIGIKVILLYN